MKEAIYSPPAAFVAALGREPLIVADVGARGGLQSRWRSIAEHIIWIGFEPDARSAERLAQTTGVSHLLPTALSERPGRVTLYRTRDEGDSSLLQPNRSFLSQFGRPERFDVIDEIQVDTDTLDNQLASIGVAAVDVLKLDTQGSELAILHGATRVLAKGVMALDIEVEFSPLYENQPLFADVDTYLRGFELQLMDLSPKRWPYAAGEGLRLARGQVVWGEAVYFPTIDRLLRDIAALPVDEQASRLAKACLVALSYGLADFAMGLLDGAATRADAVETSTIQAAVQEWDNCATAPNVPITIEVTPEQLRALQESKARTGMKPTGQLRALLKQWMKGLPH